MAWVAVHENGKEGVFSRKPTRGEDQGFWYDEVKVYDSDEGLFCDTEIPLPKGSIKKLIGRDLTWEDNPVKLKEE